MENILHQTTGRRSKLIANPSRPSIANPNTSRKPKSACRTAAAVGQREKPTSIHNASVDTTPFAASTRPSPLTGSNLRYITRLGGYTKDISHNKSGLEPEDCGGQDEYRYSHCVIEYPSGQRQPSESSGSSEDSESEDECRYIPGPGGGKLPPLSDSEASPSQSSQTSGDETKSTKQINSQGQDTESSKSTGQISESKGTQTSSIDGSSGDSDYRRTEKHRNRPICPSCHKPQDPETSITESYNTPGDRAGNMDHNTQADPVRTNYRRYFPNSAADEDYSTPPREPLQLLANLWNEGEDYPSKGVEIPRSCLKRKSNESQHAETRPPALRRVRFKDVGLTTWESYPTNQVGEFLRKDRINRRIKNMKRKPRQRLVQGSEPIIKEEEMENRDEENEFGF